MIRQRIGEFGLLGAVNCRKVTSTCMVGKGCLVGFVTQTPLGATSSDQQSSPLPGMGEWGTFKDRILYPAFRQVGESRELLLCLLVLSSFWLKIILMSKYHILDWYILIPMKHNSWENNPF